MDGEARRLVDFERAEVVRRKVPVMDDQPLPYDLVVTGTKPRGGMEVAVAPEDVKFVMQPDYFPYEVTATPSGAAQQEEPAPYRASCPIGAVGTRGVAVIGATVSIAREVPPDRPMTGFCRDWVALRKQEPGEVPLLYVAGRCAFPSSGYAIELQRHESQDSAPDDLLLDLVVRAPDEPVGHRTVAAPLDIVWRESTTAGYATVSLLPEGPRVPVEEVDGVGFLAALMRRSVGR